MWFRRKKKQTPEVAPQGIEALESQPLEHVSPIDPPVSAQETPDIAHRTDSDAPLTETAPAKEGFFSRLTKGLSKSSSKLGEQITGVFTKAKLDNETLDALEDILIMSDMGTAAAAKIRAQISKDRFDKDVDEAEIKSALTDAIADILKPIETHIDLAEGHKPQIMIFVGVNGAGKTTTIGKIAHKLTKQGAKVLLVAGDTFRAAAVEQLSVWGSRVGAPVMTTTQGGDAAALAFEAIKRGQDEGFDCVLIDTAGRLQNRAELMSELAKILRVIRKVLPDAPHHALLVLDASVGQNALSQVEAFQKTADVTGLVMTKLDGTAKGGVLVSLAEKYNLPMHFIGVGESVEDLDVFDAQHFAKALVGT